MPQVWAGLGELEHRSRCLPRRFLTGDGATQVVAVAQASGGARAAVAFARERGAHAIEAYPITTKDVIAEELHAGAPSVFAERGAKSMPSAGRGVDALRPCQPTACRAPHSGAMARPGGGRAW